MEIKSCNTHFIQAVKGGLVIKVRNRDPHGKPALASKFIKDVYDAEDALRLGGSSPVNRSMPAGLMLNSEHVKHEIPCFPVVDRILWEATVSVPEADVGVDFDLDDETTLTQLRKRFLVRKRKFSLIASDRNTNQACTNEKAVEDESDLNEPLINWKLKNLKGSRSKRKCTIGVAVTSCSVKSEESQLYESSVEAGHELNPVLRIKSEVQEPDELENLSRTFSGYLFSHADNGAPSPVDEAHSVVGEAPNEFQKMADHDCQEPVLPAKEYNWSTDEISNEHLEDVEPLCILVPWDACNEAHNRVAETSEEFQKISDHDAEEPLLYVEGQNCVTNEISYEHLEDVEPFCILVPQEGINVKLETPEIDSQESPDFRKHSEVNSLSGGSSRIKEIFERGNSFGFQVCNMSIEGTENHHELNGVRVENEFRTDSPQGPDDSHSFPSRKYGSSQDCISSVGICNNLDSTESTTLETEQPLTCMLDDIRKDGLSHAGHLEEKLSETRGKQTSAARITNVEMQSCKENQTFDSVNADTQSTQELHQPPGRLLCTRKAISPSSQEQLCLAMNSAELRDYYVDQYKSERKFFEKQIGKRTSSLRSEVQHAKIAANHGGNGKVIQRKVIISAKNIMNRSQSAKSNLEGPRFSHTLPNLNTGCTSIEGCSESAIAFSQRQLHDMEALAEKLMNELKSMKDIVEQKLLFEAYRNVSLRNDADEVKSAISNAAKVEEVAQKWLSMMARDCHRFCKIMKLSPMSAAASKDAGPKQRRKIMFADEVGGKLCHVKVFEVGMNDGIKEVEHSI